MKSTSSRSKHGAWRQQIRILCRYSTFNTLLNKDKKTENNSEEMLFPSLHFRLPPLVSSSQREVDMTETCSKQTSCSVVLISMHDCIWIGAEKAFTAQFHAQWDIWQISPSENRLLRFGLLSFCLFFLPISVFLSFCSTLSIPPPQHPLFFGCPAPASGRHISSDWCFLTRPLIILTAALYKNHLFAQLPVKSKRCRDTADPA